MQYGLATVEDLPAIQEFVASQNYFMPMEPCALGGQWLIATDDEGKIRGTLWFFHQAPHAYVDYWAGKGMVAAKLGLFFRDACEKLGIQYVRAVIADRNDAAIVMATNMFEMHESGESYRLVFRRV